MITAEQTPTTEILHTNVVSYPKLRGKITPTEVYGRRFNIKSCNGVKVEYVSRSRP